VDTFCLVCCTALSAWHDDADTPTGGVHLIILALSRTRRDPGGAPAIGDSDAWPARIDQGMDTLIDNALNGYSGSTGIMPRRGGRLDLSDAEVIGAAEYMVERASP
jgi:hypothetical protein